MRNEQCCEFSNGHAVLQWCTLNTKITDVIKPGVKWVVARLPRQNGARARDPLHHYITTNAIEPLSHQLD